MVLTELGNKLTSALKELGKKRMIDDEALTGVLKSVCRALMESDVNVAIVSKMRQNIMRRVELEDQGTTDKVRLIKRAVYDELVSLLDPGNAPFKPTKGRSNVIMFVGLQGAGKTTTIAKYARFYARKGWKVGMVCADTFRAGAFDQLKQNATRVRVPFYGSYTEPDPVKIARDGVAQFREEGTELIIVDTSGRHKQEEALFEEMKQVSAPVTPDDVVFVMDSTIGQSAKGHALAFKSAVAVGSVIITKLDGHAKGGGAISAVAATRAPIIFYGTGEHFDDLEAFDPQGFVSRLLGMGDMRALIGAFSSVDQQKQTEVLESIRRGEFTMRDMYNQFQNIMSLGPLNKVMDMLPSAMTQMMQAAGGSAKDSGNRLKRFIYMMDSMTDAELDGLVSLTPTRTRRIAMGSGTTLQEVNMLIMCQKKFGKMIGKMGKSGLMRGGDAGLAQQMARNPQGVMQQLARSMDPRMLKQIGGAQNMMGMMKKMAGMDPSALQGMMGNMGDMAGLMGGAGRGGGKGRRRRR